MPTEEHAIAETQVCRREEHVEKGATLGFELGARVLDEGSGSAASA